MAVLGLVFLNNDAARRESALLRLIMFGLVR